MKYVSFSDESYSDSRLNSIAAFSLKSTSLSAVNHELNNLLQSSSVKEFKWKKLKDARYKYCAIKLIEAVWKFIENDDARIDVLIWDVTDSRHNIRNRDDKANYGRMFFR